MAWSIVHARHLGLAMAIATHHDWLVCQTADITEAKPSKTCSKHALLFTGGQLTVMRQIASSISCMGRLSRRICCVTSTACAKSVAAGRASVRNAQVRNAQVRARMCHDGRGAIVVAN